MRYFSKDQQTKQLIWSKKKCYLTNHIDQVEELTEDELGSIEIVFADGFSQIVYQFHPLHNIGFIKYFM